MNLQDRIGITFILVTHDQEEAMTMSDRIGVMRDGQIHQIGAPREVYEYPNSRFVADFIGSANLLTGEVIAATEGMVQVRLAATGTSIFVASPAPVSSGATVTVMVRPEKLQTVSGPAAVSGDANLLSGAVQDIAYLGDMSVYHVEIADGLRIQVAMANRLHTGEEPITWDDTIHLTWHPGDGVVLTS